MRSKQSRTVQIREGQTLERRVDPRHADPERAVANLKVSISGAKVEGSLNGKLDLEHTLPAPVSGKIGAWSKADTVVYFDDYRVTLAPHG